MMIAFKERFGVVAVSGKLRLVKGEWVFSFTATIIWHHRPPFHPPPLPVFLAAGLAASLVSATAFVALRRHKKKKNSNDGSTANSNGFIAILSAHRHQRVIGYSNNGGHIDSTKCANHDMYSSLHWQNKLSSKRSSCSNSPVIGRFISECDAAVARYVLHDRPRKSPNVDTKLHSHLIGTKSLVTTQGDEWSIS